MKQTHTSGPWKVYISEDSIMVGNDQGESGVEVVTEWEPQYADGRDEANARLIAAAPEMHGALQNVAAHFDFVGEEDEAVAAAVRALLARIDGGQ